MVEAWTAALRTMSFPSYSSFLPSRRRHHNKKLAAGILLPDSSPTVDFSFLLLYEKSFGIFLETANRKLLWVYCGLSTFNFGRNLQVCLVLSFCLSRCFSRSRNRRQEPVGSEFPPNAPYPPRDTASQMNMQSKRYPVPSYTVNQQPYGEPFHYKPPVSSPKPVLPSREQHFIPSR
ncbi:hypothetical protein JD844_031087 [Phrynosoma platyrhinos]|uniref:Uncharacterized protein n=1 Tax=Phrynosoma platyrhinos TaxID=52577 RepID=A0ABQ7T0J7_PHRPL|nr:hypothetical protein JD844_031087 [Phrynosoma platyrhinos]